MSTPRRQFLLAYRKQISLIIKSLAYFADVSAACCSVNSCGGEAKAVLRSATAKLKRKYAQGYACGLCELKSFFLPCDAVIPQEHFALYQFLPAQSSLATVNIALTTSSIWLGNKLSASS